MHAVQRPSLHVHTTALGKRGSQWRPFSSRRSHHGTSPCPRHRTQLSVTSQTDIPQTDTDYRQPSYPIPQNAEQVAQQALAACQRAWKDGVRRQQLELLLPLIGASDIDDWPGGIRQQFKAVLPMVESIIKGLKGVAELQGPLQASIWDQGDAVGAWIGDRLVAVVFPTPETLPKATEAAGVDAEHGKLALLINPQWQPGQVISDFGFGAKRRDCEKFLTAFQDVYYLKQQRISGDEILSLVTGWLRQLLSNKWTDQDNLSTPVQVTRQGFEVISRTLAGAFGQVKRWRRVYPFTGAYVMVTTVYLTAPKHAYRHRLLLFFSHVSHLFKEAKLSYRELEAILKGIQGSGSSQTWAQRLRSEFAFNKDSLNRKK